MKSFRHNALLFVVLATVMFLMTVEVLPSAVVEGKTQTQSLTNVCDDKTESCRTTICSNGQPCMTIQDPPKKETNPGQDGSISNVPVEGQTPVEGQGRTPVEGQASVAPEEVDPFFEDFIDRDFD